MVAAREMELAMGIAVLVVVAKTRYFPFKTII